jgi:hypothetical protein
MAPGLKKWILHSTTSRILLALMKIHAYGSKALQIINLRVDENLFWKSNTDSICTCIRNIIWNICYIAIKQIKEFVNEKTLVHNALIQPYFSYGCEV